MCRWIAYTGQPVFIDQVVTLPKHSLVQQSFDAKLRLSADGSILNVNGDGFGLGWYCEKDLPGVFKDESPAWSNQNLRNLCEQIKAHTFFAHVRASTTGAVQRTNCHPFKYDNWLFQHNGLISNFESIRHDLICAIDRSYYPNVKGNTDSEIFFHIALTNGLQDNPKAALQKTVQTVQDIAKTHKTEQILNLSCALSDGKTLYTIRYAEGEEANTQFYSSDFVLGSSEAIKDKDAPDAGKHVVVVSEPLDHLEAHWTEVPQNAFCTIENAQITIDDFM